jgi:hypothetical protein
LDLPTGIQTILEYHLGVPWIPFLAGSAGVSSLKSYTGSSAGGVIDADTVSMKADLERLVFASFLVNRDAFRETTLVERGINMENLLLDPRKGILPGAADFNLRSAAILRFLSMP